MLLDLELRPAIEDQSQATFVADAQPLGVHAKQLFSSCSNIFQLPTRLLQTSPNLLLLIRLDIFRLFVTRCSWPVTSLDFLLISSFWEWLQRIKHGTILQKSLPYCALCVSLRQLCELVDMSGGSSADLLNWSRRSHLPLLNRGDTNDTRRLHTCYMCVYIYIYSKRKFFTFLKFRTLWLPTWSLINGTLHSANTPKGFSKIGSAVSSAVKPLFRFPLGH